MAEAHIKIDSEAVEKVQDIIENLLANPWNGSEIANLSTGVLTSDMIKDNLRNARKYGVRRESLLVIANNRFFSTITMVLGKCIWSTKKNQLSQTYAATRKRNSSGEKIS